MSSALDSYIAENQPRFLSELKDLLRIPSVSTLPAHRGDVRRAAEFVADHLRTAGMENVELIEGPGHPLLYADWLHAPGRPTVLCYGHYDVQPADPLDLWLSAPFEPEERDGNLYARGSADDKGQMYIHVKAVEALMKVHGTLPLNVKFLIEGEEEVGGASIAQYVAGQPEKLRADVALVSDTHMYAPGLPTLEIGLRGLVYLEVEAVGAMRDLHSGSYGGVAPNALFGLIELLAKVKNAQGEIQVPGIYDRVRPPSEEERASWATLPFDEKEFLREEVGSTQLTGETNYSVFERIWARPTFEVHGIRGGFTGEGSKTVIPATATAKVSFRLVPDQDPDEVSAAFAAFVKDNTPRGIQMSVKVLGKGPGLLVDMTHPAMQVAARAFSDVFGAPTVLVRGGGSIPIVGDFAKHLNMPTILMGFGLPDDGLHSPNEKFAVSQFEKGVKTVVRFFELYGAEPQRS